MTEITTAAELDALPVGSVVLDLGPDRAEANAPVISCKASDGNWHVTGTPPDRRWNSYEIVRDSAGSVLVCVHRPDQQPTAQPTVEAVALGMEEYIKRATIPAGNLFTEPVGVSMPQLARAMLARLPGRPESIVKAEALGSLHDLVSDWQANGNSRPLGDSTADIWHKCARQLLDRIEAGS
jgi:hypothetical protein